jgi:hypothetical protein
VVRSGGAKAPCSYDDYLRVFGDRPVGLHNLRLQAIDGEQLAGMTTLKSEERIDELNFQRLHPKVIDWKQLFRRPENLGDFPPKVRGRVFFGTL